MNLSQKRLMHDCKQINTSPLYESGIYHKWDDDDLYHVQAVIFGPGDTPYQHGAYFFDIHFTDKFPFAPPKVKFMTLDGKVRFNPNLYVCGKVCLSILGTWSGPGWTSVQNISSVLLSIQTLLNNFPIQNEPGFEKESGKKSKDYNKMIEHANIRLATLAMINKPPKGFECFQEILAKNFFKHYDFFLKTCHTNSLKSWENMTMKAPIYSWQEKYRYVNMTEEVMHLYESLQKKYPDIYQEVTQKTTTDDIKKDVQQDIDTKISAQKGTLQKSKIHLKKRKAPTQSAKKFDIGYTIKSDNSPEIYEVMITKNNVKRWRKVSKVSKVSKVL
jgi:ubiquitin-protein ligase